MGITFGTLVFAVAAIDLSNVEREERFAEQTQMLADTTIETEIEADAEQSKIRHAILIEDGQRVNAQNCLEKLKPEMENFPYGSINVLLDKLMSDDCYGWIVTDHRFINFRP